MKQIRSQKGQFVAESVLLMVIMASCVLVASNYFNSSAVFQSLVQGPWTHLQGMVEAGVWAPPAQAKLLHPNMRDRHSTIEGDL